MDTITPTPEARRTYWRVLDRIVAGERVPAEETLAAAQAVGYTTGKTRLLLKTDLVDRDLKLLFVQRDGLQAELDLPALRQRMAVERAAIIEKGTALGLARPLIHGDTCGNVLTRHDALRETVETHSKTVADVRAAEERVRQWQRILQELDARRAGRRIQ